MSDPAYRPERPRERTPLTAGRLPLDEPPMLPVTEKARHLLTMSADELGLARHYESLQYRILAGSVLIAGLLLGFGTRLHTAPPVELAARIAIGLLLLAMMALTARCSALALLSYHSGMHYRGEATEILSQALPDGSRHPFDRDFRSADYIGLSQFAYPALTLANRALFLYSAITLTFLFGIAALVLTASPGLLQRLST